MRHFKLLPTVCALAITACPLSFSAFAEDAADDPVRVEPVCEHFIDSDINGAALVSVPEGASADVTIFYESPEYAAHEYYKANIEGGKVYAFDIEGRDTTEDDYRYYTIKISVTGGIYGATSEAYVDTFTVSDGNDNPDSYKSSIYYFTIDGVESNKDWDVISEDEAYHKIAVHLNYVLIGDVDGNKTIDASDASCVLVEYAALQTGKPSTLTSKKRIAADVNKDETIDASDASRILSYYSASLTGKVPTWD